MFRLLYGELRLVFFWGEGLWELGGWAFGVCGWVVWGFSGGDLGVRRVGGFGGCGLGGRLRAMSVMLWV